MPAIKKSVQIVQEQRVIWDAIADPDRMSDWDDTISDIAYLGNAGQGRRIEYTHTDTDRDIYAFVTRYEPMERYAYQYNVMGLTWEVEYILRPQGSVVQLQRKRTAKGIMGWVLWWRLRDRLDEEERKTILRIKDLLNAPA